MTDTIKEIWLVMGCVDNPDIYHDLGYHDVVLAQTEWQFSDGPAGERGGSSDYIDLAQGLREHSGYVIHWDASNSFVEELEQMP